eukprot:m.125392 g.125392  ORF g.125392 m.125392 type:complete len:148 (+) comp9427_c2_seq1:212-655(+)
MGQRKRKQAQHETPESDPSPGHRDESPAIGINDQNEDDAIDATPDQPPQHPQEHLSPPQPDLKDRDVTMLWLEDQDPDDIAIAYLPWTPVERSPQARLVPNSFFLPSALPVKPKHSSIHRITIAILIQKIFSIGLSTRLCLTFNNPL